MTRLAPPKISIVTPNFNGADYLGAAIDSVLRQDYPNLEYVVADGASTDGSQIIIESYRNALSTIISEPDTGHANALNKGFAATSGEIMGWINSDDLLHPGCLDRVASIFQNYPEVEWITGRASAMGVSGEIEHLDTVRPWSRLRFLAGDHRWIQQESTFWRRSLWERSGGELDESLSLANDFELWTRFFRHAPLYSVDQMLGCFRVRPGQRSVDQRADYEREVVQVLSRELSALESGWKAAFGDVLPAAPRTLSEVQKHQLEPQLRAFDPPTISVDEVRKGRRLAQGGARFSPNVSAPEPTSDLSAFKNKHAGERCFILGNGPSLNETDLDLLEGETVFACNGVFLLFERLNWRPRYYTCVDSRVLPDRASDIVSMLDDHPNMTAFFPAEIQEHAGERVRTSTRSLIEEAEGRYFFNEEVGTLDNLPWSLFSADASDAVIQPHTVAISMLQLAAYMGFSEIYLVGCDTRYTVPDDVAREDQSDETDPRLSSTSADPNHFDASYFGPGRKWHTPNVRLMFEHYRVARSALEALGIQVKNATVGGDLEVFDRIALEEVFASERPKLSPRPSTVKQGPRAKPTASLTQLRIEKALAIGRNNASFVALLAASALAALVLALVFPDWRIWIALATVAGALTCGLGAMALKTRRIVMTLTAQLRAVQNQHAKAELALQKTRDELDRVRAETNSASNERDEAS